MRIVFPLALLSLLVIIAWPLTYHHATLQQLPTQRTIKIEIQQIDSAGCSVELSCEDAKLVGSERINELSCSILNKASKPIIAGTIITSIVVEENGADNLITGYQSFDTFLHSDFRADHTHNAVVTGDSYGLYQPPTTFPSGTVKEIKVQIDYIEFADNTICGPNRAGAGIVIGMRAGAKKYKKWLVQRYRRDGLVPTLDLLNRDESASEIGLGNVDEASGASMYRKYLRRVYLSRGQQEVSKRLQRIE